MTAATYFKYRAFMSYSHKDTAYAKSIHADLESYTIPRSLIGRETRAGRVPGSLRPIFRDRDDFAAGSSLTEKTIEALTQSQFLIVVCSPNSAKSHYVNEEIRRFKLLGRRDRILAIIVDGQPGGDNDECFAPALRYRVDAQGAITDVQETPIAADLRGNADGEELARLKVIAGLLGFDLDELRKREDGERQRHQRKLTALVCLFAALFAAASASFIWALQQTRLAEAQTRIAKANAEAAEKSLNRSIEVTYGVVKTGAALYRQVGVPASTAFTLLRYAETELDKLTEEGGLDNPLLQHRRAISMINLADAYSTLGDMTAAVKRATDAKDIFQKLFDADRDRLEWRRGLAASYQKLGDLRRSQGELDLALGPHREALALRKELVTIAGLGEGELVEAIAELQAAFGSVADIYRMKNDLSKAKAAVADAQRASEKLNPESLNAPSLLREIASIELKLGEIQMHYGVRAEAIRSLKSGLRRRSRLAAAKPEDKELQWDLSEAHIKLGDAQVLQGEFDVVQDQFASAFSIREKIVAKDPGNAEVAWDLQEARLKLGELAFSRGELEEASQAFSLAHEKRTELLKRDQSNKLWQQDFALTKIRRGQVMMARGQFTEALSMMKEAREILTRLSIADEEFTDVQSVLAECLIRLGDLNLARGDAMAALRVFQEAYDIRERMNKGDASNIDWKSDLAEAASRIGDVWIMRSNPDAALTWHRKALEQRLAISAVDPDNNDWQMDAAQSSGRVGDVLSSLGRVGEADDYHQKSVDAGKRVVAMAPEHARWQFDLAQGLGRLASVAERNGRTKEAVGHLTAASSIVKSLLAKSPDHLIWKSEQDRLVGRIEKLNAAAP